MATPTGTFTTYAAVGNREDLADVIYDVSPTDTPFMSNVKRGEATATKHEWQTDALASASSSNAVIEGDDATTDTATATTRFANYCQISDKVPRVTGTQNKVASAGRKKEMSYQIAKRGRELKRDIESALCKKTAGAYSSAGAPRQLAGIGSWLWDNDVKKSAATASTVTVTSGMPLTDPTDGTAGTLTETDLKTCIQYCWVDGGDPNMVLVGAHNKQLISGFSGIATQYRDNPQTGPGTIIGAADVYVSDFGTVNIVPSRFTATDNLYVLDTSTWSVDYLRPINQFELAVTGDSERRQIIAEYTLKAESPEANGKVYTLTTS